MAKRGYLGIDESNHGRYPEIFVAVYSEIESDLLEGKYDKTRENTNIFHLLEERNLERTFRHIIVPEYYRTILNNERNIALMVIAEFINYFSSDTNFSELDSIIIDGEIRKSDIDKLSKFIPDGIVEKIRPVVKADQRFNIVNIADNIANRLRKYYSPANKNMAYRIARGLRNYRNGSRDPKNCRKYVNYIITPKPENYLSLTE